MGAAAAPSLLTQLAPYFAGLGGAASGAASGQLSAQQLAQTYALTKRGEALQEGLNANALERQTQTNPLRDQTLYNLAGMLGASPAAFNPTSMLSGTNSGPQGVGGVNQNALAGYDAKYTPGAGGVTSNVQQMILNRLGYGNVPTGTLFDNPTTPADTLTGAPTPGVTSGASNKGGFGVVPDPYSASQNAVYGSPEHRGRRGDRQQRRAQPHESWRLRGHDERGAVQSRVAAVAGGGADVRWSGAGRCAVIVADEFRDACDRADESRSGAYDWRVTRGARCCIVHGRR